MRILKTALISIISLLSLGQILHADERILSYHSDIQIFKNGGMEVTETIRVRSEQKKIKRGIYRDFPTRYKDRLGNKVVIDFEVTQVTRDNKKEPYHIKSQGNGERVYIGRENKIIPADTHTYKITYTTRNQLGFFESHDELYWNVTGNGWIFPVDEASATVHLPDSIQSEVTAEGYVGPEGSKEQSIRSRFNSSNQPRIEAARSLKSEEGLTIVVTWPKGHVDQPTPNEQLQRTLKNNLSILIALAGCAGVFLYYYAVWFAVGRDPEKGIIYPQYYPPENLSPAAARYIMRMGYDDKCFAAALINLAVQGDIVLEEKDKKYTVHKGEMTSSPFKGEMKIVDKLLGSKSSIALKQKNHSTIRAAKNALQNWLEKELKSTVFRSNSGYIAPGVIGTLAVIAATFWFSGNPENLFFALWLTMWTFGCYMIILMVIRAWKQPGASGVASGLFLSLFAIPFLGAEIFVIYEVSKSVPPFALLLLLATGLLNLRFHHLLKQPTSMGRKLMDYLEGFKMYLAVAEKDQLATIDGPEKTVELFEAYLPYALALDVEQEWAEQFSETLAAASQASSGSGSHHYYPNWYRGNSMRDFNTVALAGAVGGALASAISSSSTAPGSSSGSGGGGSSGGGGGGGGGGGW